MVTSPSSQPTHRLLAGLNAEQQRAVTTTEGPVLVVAGPGSGKTRVLTHRIAWLLEEKGCPPEGILAVTFTNKASREMRDRIGRIVGPDTASGLVMGTFHSLGVRILRQNPGAVADRLELLPNFTIYDDNDQMDIAKTAVKNANLDPKQIAPRRMLSRISAAKSQLFSVKDLAETAETYDDELVVRVFGEYEKLLRSANAVDFDDLLSLPIRLFDEVPALLQRYQQRFRYLLVDEYQDTNRVQYVMVNALAEGAGNLFVVGDPDQSIYAWRHADIRNILDFKDDHPDTQEIHLELNYRSTARIVQAADRLIRDNAQRIDRRIRTENPEGDPIALHELADQNHEAKFIVSEIRRLSNTTGVTRDQIAVMYRTTAQSRALEEEFRNSEVPYRIVGGVRFYERKEVRDVLAVLRILHNPFDRVSLERIIDNLPIGRGFGPKALESVTDYAQTSTISMVDALSQYAPTIQPPSGDQPPVLNAAARSGAQRIGTTFASLRDKATSFSLAALFDAIVEETGYRETFNLAIEEDLQRWANVLELRADLERYDGVDPAEALTAYLEQVALVADVDALDDETAKAQVTLITLHSAKGLEFPVVFITGVEEGLLPIYRAVEAEAFDPQPMEEERRLFYVGVTRAEKLLYLSYVNSRMSFGRYQAGVASRFLQAIPAELVRSSVRQYGSSSSGRGRMSSSRSGPLASSVTTWTSSVRDAPAAPRPTVPVYVAGQRVFHPKFGEGQVLEVLERRDDLEVAVEFKREGRKRLMASLARMDVIE